MSDGIMLCNTCHAPIPRLAGKCFICAPPREPREFAFRYFVPPDHKGKTLKDITEETDFLTDKWGD